MLDQTEVSNPEHKIKKKKNLETKQSVNNQILSLGSSAPAWFYPIITIWCLLL